MTVADVVDAIFRRLCAHQRAHGVGADMSLAELRLELGITEEELTEAVNVLRLAGELHAVFTVPDRMTLGSSWRSRCGDDQSTEKGHGQKTPQMLSLDDFITGDQHNLDQIRQNLPEFHDLMPLIHSLYSRAVQLVPHQTAPIFGQTLLLCHKAFLCAAVTIGRRHPDDAAPITRRAIEAASLAVAVKANPQNFELWQDYERRSARWAARHAGKKPPSFTPPKIDYPRSLDRLRSHLGTLSDAYVHFTPEFAAGQEWRRNRRGEQAYAELGYLTVDAQAIARELFISGSFYVEILEALDSECFGGTFNKDAEWRRVRKELEGRAKEIRRQMQTRRIENVVRTEPDS